MLFSELEERKRRFKLALRMGLPVFTLSLITVASVILYSFKQIPPNFIILAFALLGIMIYYIFYLIYQGFDERIIDPITKTFSREYISKYLNKQMKKMEYTIVLFSIENLGDINSQYGFLNGDIVLRKIAKMLNRRFEEKDIKNAKISHFKGGDFIVALEGRKNNYRNIVEFITLKLRSTKIEDIDIYISVSLIDTTSTTDFDKLAERLFDLKNENIADKYMSEEDDLDLNRLDSDVAKAVRDRSISYQYQAIYNSEKKSIYEISTKLIADEDRLLHQNRFMPIVMRLGLLRTYDEAVVKHAVSVLEKLSSSEKIAINISAITLRSTLFLEHMRTLFVNNETLKERIIFIFSEKNYYHHVDRFDSQIQAYRRAGILVALDRVGGLQSSLRYLGEISVDMIRFESSFTKNLDSKRVEAILKGFIYSADSLGLSSWIKMVETKEQLESAKEMGIDLLQGNFLSPIESLQGA